MATEAQVQANRLNAQKSTGPRTPEGKEKVSQNAVKHGLLAQTAVLQEQERQEYARYREEMLAELLPDADRLLGRMLLADFSGPRVLERLQLYERRIENALGRAQVE